MNKEQFNLTISAIVIIALLGFFGFMVFQLKSCYVEEKKMEYEYKLKKGKTVAV